jgi:outer membrane protein W
VQWRPLDATDGVFQPYAGAGVNLTAVWEKSGALDSTDSPLSTAPVGQLGGVIRSRSGSGWASCSDVGSRPGAAQA